MAPLSPKRLTPTPIPYPAAAPATVYAFTRGRVRYGITNHPRPTGVKGPRSGAVLATLSDRKRAFDDHTNGLIDRYAADVWSYSDYYTFRK